MKDMGKEILTIVVGGVITGTILEVLTRGITMKYIWTNYQPEIFSFSITVCLIVIYYLVKIYIEFKHLREKGFAIFNNIEKTLDDLNIDTTMEALSKERGEILAHVHSSYNGVLGRLEKEIAKIEKRLPPESSTKEVEL